MLLALLLACDLFGPDLPPGWEEAAPIDDLSQSECEGSPYDTGWSEAMAAWAEAPGLRAVGEPLHFRCAQEVEGYYKRAGAAVDVLIQPVDMDPKAVAGCDCLYRVEVGLPEDPPATVSLYRRWDDINEPNDPVLVGSAAVD